MKLAPTKLKKPTFKPPSAARSKIMSAIPSKGNRSTELAFVQLCKANRIIGWRRHLSLFGHPDFAFPKEKVAVFIDGCFWHGCPKCYRLPKSNIEFWAEKIDRNRRRDRAVKRLLRQNGWLVVRIWEHSLSQHDRIVARVGKALNNQSPRRTLSGKQETRYKKKIVR